MHGESQKGVLTNDTPKNGDHSQCGVTRYGCGLTRIKLLSERFHGAVVPKQKKFTIIDQSEYAECKVVTCARYEIPINFTGKLPGPEQVVMVTGKLVQPQPGRFLLKAKRVEIIK